MSRRIKRTGYGPPLIMLFAGVLAGFTFGAPVAIWFGGFIAGYGSLFWCLIYLHRQGKDYVVDQ